MDFIIVYCYQPTDIHIPREIYTINIDGSNNTRFAEIPIEVTYPRWSPDADKLAMYGIYDENTWSICVIDSDKSNFTRLTNVEGVWDHNPSWSPDGEYIAFTRTFHIDNIVEEIWIMKQDGSEPHFIGINGGSPNWSPDGLRLIYHSAKNGNYEICTCKLDGSDEQQLTNSISTGKLIPEYSPDGEHIAFTSINNESFRHDIAVMDSDGRNIQCLTNSNFDGSSNQTWSPDGSMLAYNSGGDIYIMNNDGTDNRKITNLSSDINATYPDWKHVYGTIIIESPEKQTCLKSYPNPFDGSTNIEYQIKKNSKVSIKVYNVLGKEVKTLIDGYQPFTRKTVVWDGNNNDGNQIPPGNYILNLFNEDRNLTRKIIKIK
ncbi:T9SS type A sorting domain-containing protein [Bacteroidota bacterium]